LVEDGAPGFEEVGGAGPEKGGKGGRGPRAATAAANGLVYFGAAPGAGAGAGRAGGAGGGGNGGRPNSAAALAKGLLYAGLGASGAAPGAESFMTETAFAVDERKVSFRIEGDSDVQRSYSERAELLVELEPSEAFVIAAVS
jgi:hypothetical protein